MSIFRLLFVYSFGPGLNLSWVLFTLTMCELHYLRAQHHDLAARY